MCAHEVKWAKMCGYELKNFLWVDEFIEYSELRSVVVRSGRKVQEYVVFVVQWAKMSGNELKKV
jgi:hypothetical protein